MGGLQLGGIINTQGDLWSASNAGGLKRGGDARPQAAMIEEISRSIAREKQKKTALQQALARYRKTRLAGISRMIRHRLRGDPLIEIDAASHRDFLWQNIFGATLPARYRPKVLEQAFFAVQTGRRSAAKSVGKRAWSAGIDTSGWDVLVAQTPFPYRMAEGTQLLVRYYDAIPVLYPDTVSEGAEEAQRHLHLLASNLRDGAHFCCISGPVRDDLLRLAPEAEGRVSVIPCMVSPLFWPEPRPHEHIQQIVAARACPPSALCKDRPQAGPLGVAREGSDAPVSARFFLAVSTLEPRKNFHLLIEAWAELRGQGEDVPDLVLIANPGWRFAEAAAAINRWRGRGLFHLWKVPMDELRALYSAAKAVICPSIVEGFNLSGVEAMRCGTPVVASDIPVHRAVYGDGAIYFEPARPTHLAKVLAEVAAWQAGSGEVLALQDRGLRQSAQYRPEVVARQWQDCLEALPGRNDAAPSRTGLRRARR